MERILPDKARLKKEYDKDIDKRTRVTRDLESFMESCFETLPSNYTVKARVKSFESYFKKYIRYLKEKEDLLSRENDVPLIHDTIGIRVVCPFLDDIEAAIDMVKKFFTIVEIEKKGDAYSFKEFGYEATHILIKIPDSIGKKYKKADDGDFSGEIAEIQIRTILQDAWSEVEHELVYKAEWTPYDMPLKRKLAAVNASLTLADTIFEEIRRYQKQLKTQIHQRRTEFFDHIENQMDAPLFKNYSPQRNEETIRFIEDSGSIDDLLLNALYAHNRGLYEVAINYYSTILEMNPDSKIGALILKHRGMAYFSQSLYEEAIEDFKYSLKKDETSYKSAYYSGIVQSCLKRWREAAEDFTKSLSIYPYQVYCLYRRAQAYYHLEDYPAALADCDAALDLDGEFNQCKRLKKLLMDKLRM
ncbi:MAG: tetratricopeptide repeat protein [Spirochaetaceae bacterium]|jgi:putative GTP pyrophosphokinase|nr:tetratricopeptide repeat protein [Spirochaetaceae bacterium]